MNVFQRTAAAEIMTLPVTAETAHWHDALVREFRQPVYQLAYWLVADSADASATTEKIFQKVFRGMKQFRGDSSLKAWIFQIAVREAARRRFRFRNSVPNEPQSRLEAGLRRLPASFRTVIVLRDMEGMSYREIAELTGVSADKVRSRLVRGRAALQSCLL